jgi:hypothetical protein
LDEQARPIHRYQPRRSGLSSWLRIWQCRLLHAPVSITSRPAVVLVVVAAGCPLTTRSSDAQPESAGAADAVCGVERWTVKTLKDRPTLVPAKLVTVRYLVTRRAPAYLPARRLPFERRVFTVFARVTLVRPAVLHRWREAGNASCDGGRPIACAALPTREDHRRRLLRLQARADRCRAERDRASPDFLASSA